MTQHQLAEGHKLLGALDKVRFYFRNGEYVRGTFDWHPHGELVVIHADNGGTFVVPLDEVVMLEKTV